jgi:hypothetical protein
MEKICEQCNSVFVVNEKVKRSREKRFCCLKCAAINNGINNKGRTFSDEINKSKGLKGELNPFFGKTHSDKLKKQIKKTKLETNLKNVKNCNLTDIEKEILDGIMVSDGCLTSTTAISARLSLGFKYSETLDDIKIALPSIIFGTTNISKSGKSFHNKSKMYGDLLLENKRWYVNGKKIIPNNFNLTPTSCYWWFIGDGYNTNGNIYLCTDSYTKEDNENIIKKINNLGFKCSLSSKNRIRFYKESSINFLKWIIPENGINKQYEYKWKIK